MPPYAFLSSARCDAPTSPQHLLTNRAVGVPYSDEMVENAAADLRAQADPRPTTRGCSRATPRPRSASSTAARGGSPRWTRWSPICRSSAGWSTSTDVHARRTSGSRSGLPMAEAYGLDHVALAALAAAPVRRDRRLGRSGPGARPGSRRHGRDPARGRRGTLTMRAKRAEGGKAAGGADQGRERRGHADQEGQETRLAPASSSGTASRSWTPAAQWWVLRLYATRLFAVAVVAALSRAGRAQRLFPRAARLQSARRGRARTLAAAEARAGAARAAVATAPLEQIAADPELMSYRAGRRRGRVHRQLRAVPRPRRRRAGLLPDAGRRRLALGRPARGRSSRRSPRHPQRRRRGPRFSRCRRSAPTRC